MNLANKITIFRIFLVPVFMILLLQKIQYGNLWAVAVFILAAATDGLDGYIARSRKQVTNLGKLLDPLADKLLISSALISLVAMDALSAWVAMIIIGREFIVTGLRMVAAAENVVIAASKLGKIKTVSQIIAIVAIIIHLPYAWIIMAFAVIFTVWSGIDYFLHARDLIKLG